jgi:hypothetical protein
MNGTPAFELTLGLNAIERSLIVLLAAAVAAALAAWGCSHVDAAAGPAGRGPWPWLTALPIAAGLGAWIGGRGARQESLALRWHHGHWTWRIDGIEHHGSVQTKLDLGSWLLLALRPQHGAARWATVGRQRAGAAWHPLRATLFAPGQATVEPAAGESAPR